MSDTSGDESIAIEIEWSPALLGEVFSLNMTADGSRDRKRHRRTVVLMVVVIAALVLLRSFPMNSGIPNNLLWFALGLMVMRAIVTFVHIPAMNRRRVSRTMSSPLFEGPLSVILAKSGASLNQALSSTLYDWAAVSHIQNEPLAAHLMLGEVLSIPIPDAALPEGVTRDELLGRVETWRRVAA